MIVHIVLCNPRDGLSREEQTRLEEAVQGLSKIPSVREMTWGSDFSGRSKGYAYAAVIQFDDREALDGYMKADEHLRIVSILNDLAPERLVVDYEPR